MNTRIGIAAIAIAVLGAACGSDGAETAEDDLTQAGKKLIGAYVETGAGAIRALVLTSDTATSNANHFFAEIDTGLRCVRAPCPSAERVEGTFTAGTKTITLKSTTASPLVEKFLGKYNYKVDGEKFSMSREGNQQSLKHVESYCAAESAHEDCSAQDLAQPRCIGEWTCAEASCGFKCGDDGGLCANADLVNGPDIYVPSADGKECVIKSVHCLTSDPSDCPQPSPPSPDFCADGTIVNGADNFVPASNGQECRMPSLHCVTKDATACPALSPLPPDFCEDGEIANGPPTFIPSSDGMECQLPDVHCLTTHTAGCPQF